MSTLPLQQKDISNTLDLQIHFLGFTVCSVSVPKGFSVQEITKTLNEKCPIEDKVNWTLSEKVDITKLQNNIKEELINKDREYYIFKC